jgi:dienelactone hydrolase
MRRALLALVLVAASTSVADARASSWVGSFRLPATAAPVDVLLELQGGRATVSMGGGHPARSTTSATVRGARVRFTLPGGVVFDGRSRGRALGGTVRQGGLHGAFRLARGTSRTLPLFGLYRSAAGGFVTVVRATGFPPWLVELPSGRVHGIAPTLTVGGSLGDVSGDGRLTPTANALTWNGTTYERVALRQREVRVGANAATLTLPPGAGPFPAVAMVHGSGPTTREEFQVFGAYCASLGIAVLADDKRGIGQSTGRYPGEAATESTLDVLARDAQAEVRFLASLPQVDKARIGLLGDSQAGWIIALAAAREKLVRFAVPLVGPTVSVGETDTWASLAGKSQSAPSGTRASMSAQVRALGPSGFDPRPHLAKLDIPVFWVFGDDDRNVPTELSVDALKLLRTGHDFTWTVLPMTHALLLLPDGLYSSLARSTGFAPGLYPAIGEWLRARGIAR